MCLINSVFTHNIFPSNIKCFMVTVHMIIYCRGVEVINVSVWIDIKIHCYFNLLAGSHYFPRYANVDLTQSYFDHSESILKLRIFVWSWSVTVNT
jgi:hypothetical protein